MTTALWSAAQMPDLVMGYLADPLAKGVELLNKYSHSVEEGRRQYLNQRQAIYAQEKRFQSRDFWMRRTIKG